MLKVVTPTVNSAAIEANGHDKRIAVSKKIAEKFFKDGMSGSFLFGFGMSINPYGAPGFSPRIGPA